MGMIEAHIDFLAVDIVNNMPVVVLGSTETDKLLPIWIGVSEASAIAMEVKGVAAARPLTHDLLKNTIEAMGGRLTRVEITELKEQTFFARLYITLDGRIVEIDARPSDSIALALKTKSPLFAEESLFVIPREDLRDEDDDEERPAAPPASGDQPPSQESLADRLRRIDPLEFGKYSL
ncbi:MAG: bifunctional nuclease family protein [candidate division Zixibacteria bacterium]|nr:bifunctional nuclease family protein [candidate division Zixibacteria bacterium]